MSLANVAIVANTSWDLSALSVLSRWLAPLGRATLLGGLLAAGVWLIARRGHRLPAGLVAALWWVVAFQFLFALAWREPIAVPILPASQQLASSPLTLGQPSPPVPLSQPHTLPPGRGGTTAKRLAGAGLFGWLGRGLPLPGGWVCGWERGRG
jgi:hypothetical protein